MKPNHKYRPTVLPRRRARVNGFLLVIVAFALSLGGLVRVSAMPAEARIQETWFAYSQEFRMDFSASVTKGSIYSNDVVKPEDLLRVKTPGEPPAYRRVLISPLTNSVRIAMPYRFKADRPAEIKATYRVDGTLTAPNLWQKPYPFIPQQEVVVNGTELTLSDLAVEIPVKKLVADTVKLIDELKLSHDQVEVKVRPVIQVTVNGQAQPVSAGVAPEFTVVIRNPATVEVDEPKVLTDDKSFTTTRVLDRTVTFLGIAMKLTTIRSVSLVALSVLAAALGIMLVLQWFQRRAKPRAGLQRLGSALIVASHFQVPADAALVDVPDVQQMIALHLRTERPVVKAGEAYYLVDGNTCYRLQASEDQAG